MYSRELNINYYLQRYAPNFTKSAGIYSHIILPALSALGGTTLGMYFGSRSIQSGINNKFDPIINYGKWALYGAVPGAILGTFKRDPSSGAVLGALAAIGLKALYPRIDDTISRL